MKVIDWRELLVKYMIRVINHEGVSFEPPRPDSAFSQEEVDALAVVSDEVGKRWDTEKRVYVQTPGSAVVENE